LVADAEDHHAATRVGERADALRDLIRVREFNFEFEISIFTAADEPEEFDPGSLQGGRGEILQKRAFRKGLGAAVFSACHLCLDGDASTVGLARPDAARLKQKPSRRTSGINVFFKP
jgi:hypothetical protein